MGKTTLSCGTIRTYVQETFRNDVSNLEEITEGEDSQAWAFVSGGKAYVVRVNRRVEGFRKDEYAYRHFNSKAAPVPRVVPIGHTSRGEAFCITEKMPGVTLQDVGQATVRALLEPTFEAWTAISRVDTGATAGFGEVEPSGNGAFQSWQEYLVSILDPESYDWHKVMAGLDGAVVEQLMSEFRPLVQSCPEERGLVHGDFGSNNVLTDGERITAVLDWDCAKYGDPLFDVANAYFWSSWLDCVDAFAGYCERHLSGILHYRERMLCYQLRIALDEIYYSAMSGDARMTEWKQKRGVEILALGRAQ